MKFYKVNNKNELERVIKAQENLRNQINDKSINQRLLAQVMEKALNNEKEIVDIQEKILFNENLEEINKKREEEGLEPLEPKPLETSLQKEQIARTALEAQKTKLNVTDTIKLINQKLKNIKRIKRDISEDPDDEENDERDQKIEEIRNLLKRTLINTPIEEKQEIEYGIDPLYQSEYEEIMSELSQYEEYNEYDEDYDLGEFFKEEENDNKMENNQIDEKYINYANIFQQYADDVIKKKINTIEQQLDSSKGDPRLEFALSLIENMLKTQIGLLNAFNLAIDALKSPNEPKEKKDKLIESLRQQVESDVNFINKSNQEIDKMKDKTDKTNVYEQQIYVLQKRIMEYRDKLRDIPNTPENKKEIENIKSILNQAIGELKTIQESKKIFTPDNSGVKKEKTGKGINLNKVPNNGQYGKVNIDMNELLNNLKLVVYKNGKKIISRKVTEDVVDLLTKKYNSKKQYEKSAIELYEKVLHHAEIRPKLIKKKEKLINDSILYYTPDEMVKELNKLTNKKGLSQLKKNKGVAILDKLLELKIIDKDQHKKIYKNNFE